MKIVSSRWVCVQWEKFLEQCSQCFLFIGCSWVWFGVKTLGSFEQRTQQLPVTHISVTLTRCSTFSYDLIWVSWARVIRLPSLNCRWSLMSYIWQMLPESPGVTILIPALPSPHTQTLPGVSKQIHLWLSQSSSLNLRPRKQSRLM